MALSNAAAKQVILSGDPTIYEAVANAAFTPGHLIELMSTGKVRKHATAGGVRPSRWFAREKEYNGANLDTGYAANEQVVYASCRPGDRVYALVAASAAAIVAGDVLESAGDGTLRKAVDYLTDSSGGTANTTVQSVSASYTQAEVQNNFADAAAAINRVNPGIVARALEAVDNSGGATPARIRVEVI